MTEVRTSFPDRPWWNLQETQDAETNEQIAGALAEAFWAGQSAAADQRSRKWKAPDTFGLFLDHDMRLIAVPEWVAP